MQRGRPSLARGLLDSASAADLVVGRLGGGSAGELTTKCGDCGGRAGGAEDGCESRCRGDYCTGAEEGGW